MKRLILFILTTPVLWVHAQLLKPVFKEDEFTGTIYQNYTDNDGYTWISTDQGVYRWDSRNMEHFTTADGLPSNEVFKCYQDSKKRVWMTFYNGDVCYYYRGKIYNKENDKRLGKLPKVHIHDILEINKIIYFEKNVKLNQLVPPINFRFDDDIKLRFIGRPLSNIFIDFGHSVGFYIGDSKILNERDKRHYDTSYLNKLRFIHNYFMLRINKDHFYTNRKDYFFFDEKQTYDSFKNPRRCFYLGSLDRERVFYDDSAFIFYSKGNSFSLNHIYPKLKLESLITNPPFFIDIKNSNLQLSHLKKIKYIQNIEKSESFWKLYYFGGALYTLMNNIDNYTFHKYHMNQFITLGTTLNNTLYNLFSSKSELYITLASSINKINLQDFSLVGNEISNKVSFQSNKIISEIKWENIGFKYGFKQNGILYFSTVQGVFKVHSNLCKELSPEKSKTLFIDSRHRFWLSKGDGVFYTKDYDPVLKNLKKLPIEKGLNVVAYEFKEDGYGNIIIPTNNGVYVYSIDNKLYHLSQSNGLTSHECTKAEIDPDGSLWIATNKGINHFSYHHQGRIQFQPINFFLKDDGILSDNIRDLVLLGDSIYVASDKGLDLIRDKNWKVDTTPIRIHINRLFINGKQIDTTAFPTLNHTQNSIQIDFSAIYYERTDRMKVFYKLIADGDTIVQEIKDKSILLQSLSPNDYIIEIIAYDQDYPFNKGRSSSISFTINPPFYQSWWFLTLSFLGIIAFISGLFWYRNRNKMKELFYEKEMSKLQLEALKAEMNPHFIFNCLNAIKDFIMKSDFDNSEYYLSKLSRLIRQALYNTKDHFISIEEEFKFLDTYVELEQLRFGHKFDYIKQVNIDQYGHFKIPTMILQPFIENAIRHGKIGQLDYQGKLYISISENENFLIFEIKDNGIGIEASQKIKEHTHTDHKSMAIHIINSRIEIYKNSYNIDMNYTLLPSDEDSEYKTQIIFNIQKDNL